MNIDDFFSYSPQNIFHWEHCSNILQIRSENSVIGYVVVAVNILSMCELLVRLLCQHFVKFI